MPFNGSGGFTRIRNWQADAAAGIKIKADFHDSEDDNFASGLSNTIAKDGQSSPTADIPFNAKKITGLANPVNPQDGATKAYVDGKYQFSTAIEITGSTPNSVLKFTGATGPWGDSYVTPDISFGAKGAAGSATWVWNDKADMTGSDVMTLAETGNLQLIGTPTLTMKWVGTSQTAAISAASGSLTLAADTTNAVAGSGIDFAIDGSNKATLQIGRFGPSVDLGLDLGTSGARFFTVYASIGTINTSDAREKTPVRPFTDAELAASKQLAGEIGLYQWLRDVEAGNAKSYCGQTVQRIIEIMEEHGLDPLAYGFLIHDTWEADEHNPAGDRYSMQADNVLFFVARGFADIVTDLTARLAALEAKA